MLLFIALLYPSSAQLLETNVAKDLSSSVLVLNSNGWSNGVIVSETGHVLTVSHGLSQSVTHTIKTLNGRKVKAHTIYRSQFQDLALLKIESDFSSNKQPWSFSRIKDFPDPINLKKSTEYFVKSLNYEKKTILPLTQSTRTMFTDINLYTFNPSWIKKLHHETPPVIADGIIISIPVKKGFSGSGLFDTNGDLVGMVIGTINVANSIKTIAIEAVDVLPILNLENKGVFQTSMNELEWMLDSLVKMGEKLNKKPARLLEIKNIVLAEFKTSQSKNSPLTKKDALIAWQKFIQRLEPQPK